MWQSLCLFDIGVLLGASDILFVHPAQKINFSKCPSYGSGNPYDLYESSDSYRSYGSDKLF